MRDVPRRTLSELAFIYDRDPHRRDVYVEGSFDASIVDWFVREAGFRGVAVYPISAIEITDDEVIAAGERAGNRSRVVVLSTFLRSSSAQRAVCIVDADFSRLRGVEGVEPPLYETDYACMEMYFFSIASFSKFLILCGQRSDWPAEVIMDSLAAVSQELFLYRYANDELKWYMDWLDSNKCCRIEDWRIALDTEGFVTRLLNKNRRLHQKESFSKCVEKLRPHLRVDARHQMNGHDLTSLLAWYARRKGISGARASVDNIRVCMTMTLDHRTLKEEGMFLVLTELFG
jgi:hypothetical protein